MVDELIGKVQGAMENQKVEEVIVDNSGLAPNPVFLGAESLFTSAIGAACALILMTSFWESQLEEFPEEEIRLKVIVFERSIFVKIE